ncbi:hypothetical protein Slin15195_G092750 [Septoria linicola]|uniref:Uncharacterized protein n=1 Tax=Septoria linicola TaxID=215465 RepID=A0A9Q9B2B9_9PEZI|nr:hypothetical protein Slin14017_G055890 [Septoria linicola]USW55956.1 hypothetical protein Slin15195_G092750 [Septoria linicola]
MKLFVVAFAYVAAAFAAPVLVELQENARAPAIIAGRDGTTEFDPDAAYKLKRSGDETTMSSIDARDGTTEFDPDAAYKARREENATSSPALESRDGTTEFNPDAIYRR